MNRFQVGEFGTGNKQKLQRWQAARRKKALKHGWFYSIWAADGTPILLVVHTWWYEWGIGLGAKGNAQRYLEEILREKGLPYEKRTEKIYVHVPEGDLQSALEDTKVELIWERHEPKEAKAADGKTCSKCGQKIHYNSPKWGYTCPKCEFHYHHLCHPNPLCPKCGADLTPT